MTQPVYDPDGARALPRRLAPLGLPVLVGLLPLASYRNAEFLHNEVPGMQVPEAVRERMRKAGSGAAARKEGVAIAREMLAAVRDRVAGAYVMPPLERYELALEVLDGFLDPSMTARRAAALAALRSVAACSRAAACRTPRAAARDGRPAPRDVAQARDGCGAAPAAVRSRREARSRCRGADASRRRARGRRRGRGVRRLCASRLRASRDAAGAPLAAVALVDRRDVAVPRVVDLGADARRRPAAAPRAARSDVLVAAAYDAARRGATRATSRSHALPGRRDGDATPLASVAQQRDDSLAFDLAARPDARSSSRGTRTSPAARRGVDPRGGARSRATAQAPRA